MSAARHIGMNSEHTQAGQRPHGVNPVEPWRLCGILVTIINTHAPNYSELMSNNSELTHLHTRANLTVRANDHEAAVGILGAQNHTL